MVEPSLSGKMRQLTKTEIDKFYLKMGQWQTPAQVNALMIAVNDIAQAYVAAQGGLKGWREAFVAMSCAQLSHAQKIKLGGDPPDFELDYGDYQRAFELVDVVPKGWHIRGEHKTFAETLNAGMPAEIRTLTHKQSEAESNAVVEDFKTQLSAKMSKSYPAETILVADIYHNVFFDSDTGIKRGLARAARLGLVSFREVWIRQKYHVLRVSKHGVSLLAPAWPVID